MLKIPTIADRAWQYLIKMILEPAHQAHFDQRSDGFRPGRCTHDAQTLLLQNLNSSCNGKDKKVIELNILQCFDCITHQTILDQCPYGHQNEFNTVLKNRRFILNNQSKACYSLKVGVVSPLLANILLNGIEQTHQCSRYADHMVFIFKTQDSENEVVDKRKAFLKLRGLNISQNKAKITTATSGFDFLGWHFKVLADGRFQSTPSKKTMKI